jgi:hypothetical protein
VATRQPDLEEVPGAPGILRHVAFRADDNVLGQARVDGTRLIGVASPRGPYDVARLPEGATVIERGPDGT